MSSFNYPINIKDIIDLQHFSQADTKIERFETLADPSNPAPRIGVILLRGYLKSLYKILQERGGGGCSSKEQLTD